VFDQLRCGGGAGSGGGVQLEDTEGTVAMYTTQSSHFQGPAASSVSLGSTMPTSRVITLRSEFCDGEFAKNEDPSLSAEQRRAHRLQWLRVQESYVRAELAALEPVHRATSRSARSSVGCGIALERMELRKRQLYSKLVELDMDKYAVKTSRL